MHDAATSNDMSQIGDDNKFRQAKVELRLTASGTAPASKLRIGNAASHRKHLSPIQELLPIHSGKAVNSLDSGRTSLVNADIPLGRPRVSSTKRSQPIIFDLCPAWAPMSRSTPRMEN